MSKLIYLDYHSTTPVDLRVAEKVYDYRTHLGSIEEGYYFP